MPDEENLNLALNTIADVTRSDGAAQPAGHRPAEQGPAPSDLPSAPHLQTLNPGERLSAGQVEGLMGDENAVEVNRELEKREGLDPDTES
ncbi:hypothetical protein DKM44_01410 [Deinococcus irradiatisoli]|uniref:Uncharacterized protein n=1 Tax=Deinococcus irradiatisoli TaxID=2202254 RepID=A0A2Z3JGJ8_9DEIO|nr:hypothetical protein [Deinococcus irradiatisoli]AWN22059.1 hypothetical protein DKM44_01410 [Deinococcus irradiatisoli]